MSTTPIVILETENAKLPVGLGAHFTVTFTPWAFGGRMSSLQLVYSGACASPAFALGNQIKENRYGKC